MSQVIAVVQHVFNIDILMCFNSELEESLLVLPFPYVIQLLELMRYFVAYGYEIELAQRCLGFLLRYLSQHGHF